MGVPAAGNIHRIIAVGNLAVGEGEAHLGCLPASSRNSTSEVSGGVSVAEGEDQAVRRLKRQQPLLLEAWPFLSISVKRSGGGALLGDNSRCLKRISKVSPTLAGMAPEANHWPRLSPSQIGPDLLDRSGQDADKLDGVVVEPLGEIVHQVMRHLLRLSRSTPYSAALSGMISARLGNLSSSARRARCRDMCASPSWSACCIASGIGRWVRVSARGLGAVCRCQREFQIGDRPLRNAFAGLKHIPGVAQHLFRPPARHHAADMAAHQLTAPPSRGSMLAFAIPFRQRAVSVRKRPDFGPAGAGRVAHKAHRAFGNDFALASWSVPSSALLPAHPAWDSRRRGCAPPSRTIPPRLRDRVHRCASACRRAR